MCRLVAIPGGQRYGSVVAKKGFCAKKSRIRTRVALAQSFRVLPKCHALTLPFHSNTGVCKCIEVDLAGLWIGGE